MNQIKKRLPRNIIIVALVALFSGLGQDLITPILPGFLLAIGISRAGIGLIDGIIGGATSIFRFVSGILSDRLRSRKGLVFIGYAVSSITRPLLALAGTFPFLAVLRGLDGFGKGTKDAPRDALIADSSGQEIRGRAFGFQRFVDTAGSVIGPLIAAGILLTLTATVATYRLIFALSIIPGIIVIFLIIFGIKEAKMPGNQAAGQKGRLPAIFWIFTFGTAIAMLTRINDALFLVRAQDSNIPEAWIPILFAGFTFLYAVLSYPLGIWSDKIGRLPLITAGWIVLAISEIILIAQPTHITVIISFIFFGLFYALTEGSGRAIIADFVPAQKRGTAYAFFHSITGVALIAGGYIFGKISDLFSASTAFELSALGTIVGALIISAVFFMHHQKLKPALQK